MEHPKGSTRSVLRPRWWSGSDRGSGGGGGGGGGGRAGESRRKQDDVVRTQELEEDLDQMMILVRDCTVINQKSPRHATDRRTLFFSFLLLARRKGEGIATTTVHAFSTLVVAGGRSEDERKRCAGQGPSNINFRLSCRSRMLLKPPTHPPILAVVQHSTCGEVEFETVDGCRVHPFTSPANARVPWIRQTQNNLQYTVELYGKTHPESGPQPDLTTVLPSCSRLRHPLIPVPPMRRGYTPKEMYMMADIFMLIYTYMTYTHHGMTTTCDASVPRDLSSLRDDRDDRECKRIGRTAIPTTC
nr:hypothetical protein CFP56_10266 [Quercus suber]